MDSIDNKQSVVEKPTVEEKKPALTDVRLMVDVKDKDAAKQLGAKWDKDLKSWYAPRNSNLSDFKPFMGKKVVALKDTKLFIPFEEKAIAKDLGVWWNIDKKCWEVKAGEDIKNIPQKYFKEPVKIDKESINFQEFAKIKGLIIDDLQTDGVLHRVPVIDGKAGAKDGAYIYFDDVNGQMGWLQNFKTGEIATLGNISEKPSTFKDAIGKQISRRRIEQEKNQDDVAKKCQYLISNVFKRANNHPYLEKKDVKALNTFLDNGDNLIVPLCNAEGKIRTFQRIGVDGTKSFVTGGEKSGNFFSFGTPKDKVIICEGFATGVSIYEATKIPTIAAMDSSNLEKVAVAIDVHYKGKINITIAADNDHQSKNNPGITFGEKAAKAVGGALIYPKFNDAEMAQKLTDFNDLAKSQSLKAVKEQIFEQNKALAISSKEIER